MAGGAKLPETNFWKLLRNVAAGANTLGAILPMGDVLKSQKGEFFQKDGQPMFNEQGKIMVEALPLGGGGGYQLRASDTGGPNRAHVYWLPWKDHTATSAKRSIFENDCDFFMTSGMTGCRFSLTPTMVLHVANSPYKDSGRTAQERTMIEEGLTGPRPAGTSRVVSEASWHPNDTQYNHMYGAFIFGMKLHTGNWVYKVLDRNPAPGTWSIL
jgi:hypothetical protein